MIPVVQGFEILCTSGGVTDKTSPSDPCCNCLWNGNARSAESYGYSFSKVAYFGQILRKTARKFLFFHKIHIFAKKSKGIYYI